MGEIEWMERRVSPLDVAFPRHNKLGRLIQALIHSVDQSLAYLQ